MGSSRERRDDEEEYDLPLFETKESKGRLAYRLFSVSIFISICLILVHRVTGFADGGEFGETRRWCWIGLFGCETWFTLYWLFTQAVRWNVVYRQTFKHRLSVRYEEKLPGVDVFVCTADPTIEPPIMVANTVLLVMAYNYPPEKLSVYLSDDGGSELTTGFPFCKKFKVEPRSPSACLSNLPTASLDSQEWSNIKILYEEMEKRIETATKLGRIPEDMQAKHKGFSEWASVASQRDHQTILQILIDSRDPHAVDIEGCKLPMLVYLAREKNQQHHHNFKAGAMNALIRVSSEISNGQIILNVDCDMYSNDSDSIRDALCVFMDEEKGHEIAYVQYPQMFHNIRTHDIYSNSLCVIFNALYIGTGCFHRRETLLGRKYSKENPLKIDTSARKLCKGSVEELEDKSKALASCTYQENTEWGNEMGLKYNCAVEDVLTGLSIKCRGWKSVYLNPQRPGFLGVSPITLGESLIQHKRWAEGHFQILLSKYNTFLYGHRKISLALQMGYYSQDCWSFNCFPTIYYLIIPPLCLLKGIPLFPKITSLWFQPFMYLILTKYIYSLAEFIHSGGTLKAWWNDQRMWIFRRITSYLFASGFVISSKFADQEVLKMYEQDTMEFGTTSPIFTTIIATLSLINLLSLVGGLKRVIIDMEGKLLEQPLVLQIVQCSVVVLINLPVYQGLFFRTDKGRIPTSVTIKSVVLVLSVCVLTSSLY
ncbi:hypothetical protein MKW94_000957 [Papaver nudicaule]|uniref:Cellulose synthase-like protein E6 n=1 Tax=Papaver nudicaule TaxID=74823 RepID=A0AA41V4C7_PAPNU|nr:hypothetical protein [Papaver nudicaule]